MAAVQPPTYLSTCYEPSDLRYERFSQVRGSGVLFHDTQAELKVTTGGSGLDLFVAAGGAFMRSGYTTPGVYHGYNDAQVTVTCDAAEAQPRIDTVVAQVIDSDFQAGTEGFSIGILKGTATASAQIANPGSANYLAGKASITGLTVCPLAYILVPATVFTGPFVDATHIRDARQDPNNPYVSIEPAAGTNIPNGGVYTQPTMGTVLHIDNDSYTLSGATITVVKDGVYTIEAANQIAGNAVGIRLFNIYVNNTNVPTAAPNGTLISRQLLTVGGSGTAFALYGSREIFLAAGSTIKAVIAHDSTTTPLSSASGNPAHITVRRVG